MKALSITALLFSFSLNVFAQGGNPIMVITCKISSGERMDNSENQQRLADPDCSTFTGMCPTGFADWEFCTVDPLTGELSFTWDPVREICDCEMNEGMPIFDASTNSTILPDADDCGCPVNTSPILMSWPSGDNFTCGYPVCYSDTFTPNVDCNGATIDVELCGIPVGGFIELDNLENCDIVENFDIIEGEAISTGNNVAFGPADNNGCFSFTLIVEDESLSVGVDFLSADDILITPDCEVTLGPLPIPVIPSIPTLSQWALIILTILLLTIGVVKINSLTIDKKIESI